mmetsp:Transcript_7776/g.11751  ORF Transcript_7776/g.11751 Transcript_7776/m.11751 type:complete len:285 (-) Transcript_7776:121-975(-)
MDLSFATFCDEDGYYNFSHPPIGINDVQLEFDSFIVNPFEHVPQSLGKEDVWQQLLQIGSPALNEFNNTKRPPIDLTEEHTSKSRSIPHNVDQNVPFSHIEEKKEKSLPVPQLERKRKREEKVPKAMTKSKLSYKGLEYIGPTKANRPMYKAKQAWKHDIYPHGISMQNGKLRVQIKQRGVNPTYPSFPNTTLGLLDAAMYRDEETMRLWESGILIRAPKFNFQHPNLDRFSGPNHNHNKRLQLEIKTRRSKRRRSHCYHHHSMEESSDCTSHTSSPRPSFFDA